MHVKTLILGAGLTGLSTAYHLEQRGETDYLVLECKTQPGGLCASQTVNGFTLDAGGHLLHLHTPYGKKLVKRTGFPLLHSSAGEDIGAFGNGLQPLRAAVHVGDSIAEHAAILIKEDEITAPSCHGEGIRLSGSFHPLYDVPVKRLQIP